ncbi:CvpA family protein [Lysobacter sp. 5GHs7-4]|uniref:CvpA family protein n=1 Tax=Lysobacter sp. 5GHs7-4 TaxID=2904253 RepID=UPI0017F507E7|nr:CvpA family protein [Lysobacter sp. 5GHs7-4]NUO77264.1 CvpA family protein [Lysobacter sp.]UHQ24442.1 CvpA family protein [Lysobacter sp. 5GHs7-4]
MGAADLILLAVVAISALLGLLRGFVGVVASLAAWILAGWAAFGFGGSAAMMMSGDRSPGLGEMFGGYALCFLGVLITVWIVGYVAKRMIHESGLSGVDRAMGFVVGVARGALIASMLVMLVGFTPLAHRREWRSAALVPLFLPGAHMVRGWMPDWAGRAMDFSGGAPAWMPSLPKIDLNMQGLSGMQGMPGLGGGNGQPFGQDVLPILNDGVLPLLKGAGLKNPLPGGTPAQDAPHGDPAQIGSDPKRDDALPMPVEQDEAFVM